MLEGKRKLVLFAHHKVMMEGICQSLEKKVASILWFDIIVVYIVVVFRIINISKLMGQRYRVFVAVFVTLFNMMRIV